MDLKFMPRGGVDEAVAEFRRDFAETAQMCGRGAAGGKAHAQHVSAVLALFVNTGWHADDAELAFVDRTGFEPRDDIFKFIQFNMYAVRNAERPSGIRLFAHIR
jgi:hypothetical protein